MNFCKDCKHCTNPGSEYARCLASEKIMGKKWIYDPVTGAKNLFFCSSLRIGSLTGSCSQYENINSGNKTGFFERLGRIFK